MSLLEGFLDPRSYDDNGNLTPDQAAGSVINGTTNQVANQIDEMVIDTLRNNLLGLPLDLPTINMVRARDVGIPPLQTARQTFFDATGEPLLEPYASWTDFGLHLKNGENFGRGGNQSLVNFVAAYGTHPTIVDESTIAGKREAANLIVNGTPTGAPFVERLAGPNRYATAAAISSSHFTTPGVPVVYITSGLNFPDALAGGPAAAADGGPILLVTPTGIPAATAVELARLNPARIEVLGGPVAVSNAVVQTLETYTSGSVTRLAGADRFATAAAISRATFAPNVPKVYIANGLNFPDALAGSAAAAHEGAPMLLVTPTGIPSATAVELARLNPASIVVLGGPVAVNNAVLASLNLHTTGSVTRLAGPDRIATAVEISEATYPSGAAKAFVATGMNFPDALAAAPIAGLQGAPLLLVPANGLPAAVAGEISRLGAQGVAVLGGPAAVTVPQELAIEALAPISAQAPADRLAFLNSEPGSAWANTGPYDTVTGLEDVDFWVGGLAEALEPFGGMLGSTFNFVFEKQLENLQFGDRFYYLFRNQGNQLFAALEGNSFSTLIQRNTDASLLPADIFSVADPFFDMEALTQPLPEGLNLLAGTYVWDGDEHIEIHGCRTPAGTECPDVNDSMRGGQGDDSLWGYAGNDRIEGGSGNDGIIGGEGNDIITDTFGDDNLKGNRGNDAINAGAGDDLILGGQGKDFVTAGVDFKSAFLTLGDDSYLGGPGRDTVFGGEGDDWIEGGAHADLLQGDNANQFQNDPNGGHDVLVGGAGADDNDSDGGDDVIVGAVTATDRYEGMLGFDWVTFKGDTEGAVADLDNTELQQPDIGNLFDRFDLVEAVSGWDHDDVLRGSGAAILGEGGGLLGGHSLTQAQLDRVNGLRDLLGGGADPVYALPLMEPDPSIAVSNNIILGGAGSDIIEGRAGYDFIDGAAWLDVYVEYRPGRHRRRRAAGQPVGLLGASLLGSDRPGRPLHRPRDRYTRGGPDRGQHGRLLRHSRGVRGHAECRRDVYREPRRGTRRGRHGRAAEHRPPRVQQCHRRN